MKEISYDDFWSSVRSSLSNAEYQEMRQAFRGTRSETTTDAVSRRFAHQGEWAAKNAELNGCHAKNDVTDYYEELHQVARRVFGEDNLERPDFTPTAVENQTLRSAIEEIDSEFDSQEKCHPSYDSFHCFCP